MSTPYIELRGVKKHYAGTVVLDGIDLPILRGETMALVGPSGGGKSTILRCINGLCAFDAGTVRVGDHTLTADAPRAEVAAAIRRQVGMIFQDYQLFPHLTALGNVMEAPVHVAGVAPQVAKARALELLARVGLDKRAHAYPSQLSGGQKQRVAIARALAMEPVALLCDEITAALDPELKAEVLEVLEDLSREHMTLIVVTHELGFARRAAHRVAVLAEGQVIELGPVTEVLDHPKQPITQRFLECVLH